ncbi:hypothetical protein OC498_14000, partial [Acinetobacter bohemicus]|uniref:hypothetical protein n=1 Tax=Acinetobacter TaxID=469 RepID=UPI00209A6B0D
MNHFCNSCGQHFVNEQDLSFHECHFDFIDKKLSTNQLNPNTLTCENTGESLKTNIRFATNIVVPTPIY